MSVDSSAALNVDLDDYATKQYVADMEWAGEFDNVDLTLDATTHTFNTY